MPRPRRTEESRPRSPAQPGAPRSPSRSSRRTGMQAIGDHQCPPSSPQLPLSSERTASCAAGWGKAAQVVPLKGGGGGENCPPWKYRISRVLYTTRNTSQLARCMLLEGDMKGAPIAQSSGHPKRPSDRLWPVVRITTLHGWPRALHDMRGRLGDETPRAVDARRRTALRALRMRRPDRRSRGASFDHATARARPPSHGDEAFASTRNRHTARAVLAASGSDIPSPGGIVD